MNDEELELFVLLLIMFPAAMIAGHTAGIQFKYWRRGDKELIERLKKN